MAIQFFNDVMTNTAGVVLSATTSTSGHDWTTHPDDGLPGEFVYDNANRVHIPGAFGGSMIFPEVTPPSPDYYVEAVFHVHTIGTPQYIGISVRLDPTVMTNYTVYYGTLEQSWAIERVVNHATVDLDVFSQVLSTSTSYTVRLSVVGSQLVASIDGIVRLSATDATISQAGRPGLYDYHDPASTNTTLMHTASFSATSIDTVGHVVKANQAVNRASTY